MEAGVWAFTRAVILHPYRGIDEWETIMIILGVILLLAKFDQLAAMGTFAGMIVIVMFRVVVVLG